MQDGEGPVRPVRMSGFYLDTFEVRHSAQNFRVWLQALASVGSPQLITKNQALSWTGA